MSFHTALTIAILSLVPTLAWAQGAHEPGRPAGKAQTHSGAMHGGHGATADTASPYAGQEQREIKALAPEAVRQLLQGEGMGLAKAAELNRYPGPRHVLDLAAELELSGEQRQATQALFDSMRAAAVALGTTLLERERELDARFAQGHIDEETLDRLTAEIGRLQGALRATHLRAHLEMRRILTERQIAAYDHLRGYASL